MMNEADIRRILVKYCPPLSTSQIDEITTNILQVETEEKRALKENKSEVIEEIKEEAPEHKKTSKRRRLTLGPRRHEE